MISLDDLKSYPDPNLALFFAATTMAERGLYYHRLKHLTTHRTTYTIYPQDTSGVRDYCRLTLVEIACILGQEEQADFLINDKDEPRTVRALCFALNKSDSFSQKIAYKNGKLYPEFDVTRHDSPKYIGSLEEVCIHGSLTGIQRVHEFVNKILIKINLIDAGINHRPYKDPTPFNPFTAFDLHRWLKIAMSSNDVGVLDYILNHILDRPFEKMTHEYQALVLEHLIRHTSNEVFNHYASKWKNNILKWEADDEGYVYPAHEKPYRCQFINTKRNKKAIDSEIETYFCLHPSIQTLHTKTHSEAAQDKTEPLPADTKFLDENEALLNERVINYIRGTQRGSAQVDEQRIDDMLAFFPLVRAYLAKDDYDLAAKELFEGNHDLLSRFLNEWCALACNAEEYKDRKYFYNDSPLLEITPKLLNNKQFLGILSSHINTIDGNPMTRGYMEWANVIKYINEMVRENHPYLKREDSINAISNGVKKLLSAVPRLLEHALGHPSEFTEYYTGPLLDEHWNIFQTQKDPLNSDQLRVLYTYFTFVFSHPGITLYYHWPLTRKKFLEECFLIPELREKLAKELDPAEIRHWYGVDNPTTIRALFLTIPGVPAALRDQHVLDDEWEDYSESAMRGLNPREQNVYNAIVTSYQEKVKSQGEKKIHAEISSTLQREYLKDPIKITLQDGSVCDLPLEKEALDQLNLSHDDMQIALQAYYKHPIHTAYRFLLTPNNPWMYEHAEYILYDPLTNHKCADFRLHLPLICCSWLLVKENDPPIMPKTYTHEHRLNCFVTILAWLGRRHNKDSIVDLDDGLGDRPSCASGMRRELVRIGLDYTKKATDETTLERKPNMSKEEALLERDAFICRYYQQHLSYAKQREIAKAIGDDDIDALKKFDIPRPIVREWLRGFINEDKDIATLPINELTELFSQTENPHLYFYQDIQAASSQETWKNKFNAYLQGMKDYHATLPYTHPLRRSMLTTLSTLEAETAALFDTDIEKARASSIRCYQTLHALNQKACDSHIAEKLSNFLHHFASFLAVITIFPALFMKFGLKKNLSQTLFKSQDAIKTTEELKEFYEDKFHLESETHDEKANPTSKKR